MSQIKHKWDTHSPREKAWILISDLFVDQEHDDFDLKSTANALKALGFSVKELNDIYLYEVAPVVWGGAMMSIWPCFDTEWLIKSINEHINSSKYKSSLIANLTFRLFSRKWKKVKSAL